MTEEMQDLWTQRDLVVLRAVVVRIDQQGRTQIGDLVSDTGMDHEDVELSIRALARDGLIERDGFKEWNDFHITGVRQVSGDAYRLVGAWPSTEQATERLIAALNQIVDDLDVEEEKYVLRKTIGILGKSGRELGVAVAAAILTGQT